MQAKPDINPRYHFCCYYLRRVHSDAWIYQQIFIFDFMSSKYLIIKKFSVKDDF